MMHRAGSTDLARFSFHRTAIRHAGIREEERQRQRQRQSKGKGKGRVPGELQKWIYRTIDQGIRQGLAKVTKQFNKPRKGRSKGKAKSEEDRKAFLQAQQERNEAHKQSSNRECLHDDTWFTGRLKRRTSAYGWIALANLELLPEDLREATTAMLTQKRNKMLELKSKNQLFNTNVVFMHGREVEEDQWRLCHRGDELKFKLYTDSVGVGAYSIQKTKKAQR